MKPIAIASLSILIVAPLLISNNIDTQNPATVHEWGTFTSVAGRNGDPITWAPLYGKPDLPCFVYRSPKVPKQSLFGLVRMETPVLYFYASQPTTASVHVDFPKGWITEWYPHADSASPSQGFPAVAKDGQIEWNHVEVLPGQNLQFPAGKGGSHYYAARETDSASLRIPRTNDTPEQEKLLFYRGVGNFQPPLRSRFIDGGTDDGKLEIRNASSAPVPVAIVFQNRAGKVGYRVVRNLQADMTVEMPKLSSNVAALQTQLASELEASGLYRKEAVAMVNTWKDSWFEDGTRLFYILPQAEVDSVLPLTVTPVPTTLKRVFVGRIELLSPAMRQDLQTAVDGSDKAALAKYGRFLEPFLNQINLPSRKVTGQPESQLIANIVRGALPSDTATCVP